jgi:hypothetical protein
VRAIVQDTRLLRGVTFRPSVTTNLGHEASLLPPASLALALQIADGSATPKDPRLDALSPDEKALVLTVAYDDVRFVFLSGEVDRKVVAERARAILVELSRVRRSGELAPPPPVPSVRPDEGHRTARLSVGAGWRRSRPFVQMQIRPAFHDLLDPQGGYTTGAQIDFLQVALRAYGDVDLSGALRNSVSAGGGGEVGVYFSLMQDRLRTHLSSDVLEFALGQQHTAARWGFAQRLSLGPQSALRFEVAARRDYGDTWVEGLAEWQWFF